MKYILIMWLANSSPSSVVFDTAEACVLGRIHFFEFTHTTSTERNGMAFCTPQSGKGKVLDSSDDAVNPGNPT